MSIQQLGEAAGRAESALTLEKLSGGVLAGLRGEKGLASFQKCVEKRMCVNGVLLCDGDVRMVFVRSGL